MKNHGKSVNARLPKFALAVGIEVEEFIWILLATRPSLGSPQ
jgi:hypothetical protein